MRLCCCARGPLPRPERLAAACLPSLAPSPAFILPLPPSLPEQGPPTDSACALFRAISLHLSLFLQIHLLTLSPPLLCIGIASGAHAFPSFSLPSFHLPIGVFLYPLSPLPPFSRSFFLLIKSIPASESLRATENAQAQRRRRFVVNFLNQ